MTNDTTPGGKTQEEVDQENEDADELRHLGEIAVLQKENKELAERLEGSEAHIRLLAKREEKLQERMGRLHEQLDVVVPPREELRRMTTLASITLVLFFAFTIMPGREPEPVVCPPAPACPEPVVAEAPSGPPTTTAEVEGYFVSTEMGNVRVPWPDGSLYDSETFVNDCQAVCEVPTATRRGTGRILTVDPAHLVCICFHADSPWPVTRWINWERVP